MSFIVGIDEVGRGPWAGPLVAAAVLLESNFAVPKNSSWKLDDSKKLNMDQRKNAAQGVRQNAIAVGIGWVSSQNVDELGLTEAVRLAMRSAIDQLDAEYNEVIIDGNYDYLALPKSKAIIKADGSILAVSAASIIAKVARDHYMLMAAERFPGYGFEKHVGYGSATHRAAIEKLGLTPLHRRSFKPVLQSQLF